MSLHTGILRNLWPECVGVQLFRRRQRKLHCVDLVWLVKRQPNGQTLGDDRPPCCLKSAALIVGAFVVVVL